MNEVRAFAHRYDGSDIIIEHHYSNFIVRSICGSITIEIIPNTLSADAYDVSSYLSEFRDSSLHLEDVVNNIASYFYDKLKPKFLRVVAEFFIEGIISKFTIDYADPDSGFNALNDRLSLGDIE